MKKKIILAALTALFFGVIGGATCNTRTVEPPRPMLQLRRILNILDQNKRKRKRFKK